MQWDVLNAATIASACYRDRLLVSTRSKGAHLGLFEFDMGGRCLQQIGALPPSLGNVTLILTGHTHVAFCSASGHVIVAINMGYSGMPSGGGAAGAAGAAGVTQTGFTSSGHAAKLASSAGLAAVGSSEAAEGNPHSQWAAPLVVNAHPGVAIQVRVYVCMCGCEPSIFPHFLHPLTLHIPPFSTPHNPPP